MSHRRLEKRLDIKSKFAERSAYRAHLRGMWGFCAGIEHTLDTQSFGGALVDYEGRRKLPLLSRDLIELGENPLSIASLAQWRATPCLNPAVAFGRAYVLEGATLGGRTLLPLVERSLGLTAARGASFLASYGGDVAEMWQSFRAALNSWCRLPERRADARLAAIGTFEALGEWLCGAAS